MSVAADDVAVGERVLVAFVGFNVGVAAVSTKCRPLSPVIKSPLERSSETVHIFV